MMQKSAFPMERGEKSSLCPIEKQKMSTKSFILDHAQFPQLLVRNGEKILNGLKH